MEKYTNDIFACKGKFDHGLLEYMYSMYSMYVDSFSRRLIFANFANFVQIRENFSPRKFTELTIRENKSSRNYSR